MVPFLKWYDKNCLCKNLSQPYQPQVPIPPQKHLQAIRLESTEHLLSSPRLHDKLPDVYTMVALGNLCQSPGKYARNRIPRQDEPLPSFAINSSYWLSGYMSNCVIYVHIQMNYSIPTQVASAKLIYYIVDTWLQFTISMIYFPVWQKELDTKSLQRIHLFLLGHPHGPLLGSEVSIGAPAEVAWPSISITTDVRCSCTQVI